MPSPKPTPNHSWYPCALVCDEFATVRAYNMSSTIATARSNNIIPILSIQDLSQLRTLYSQQEADSMLNISGNILCGQSASETARWTSDRFPKILQDRPSISVNSTDTNITTSQQWEPSVTPATISALSSGEFVGLTTDDPTQDLKLKTFHAKLIRQEELPSLIELPQITKIDANILNQHYKKVKIDINVLVTAELARIKSNTSENE